MSCDCNTLVVGEAGPQGPQGLSGTNGSNGTNGINAFTNLTASFVQPAIGGSVTVTVAENRWVSVGQIIYISNAGYYSVVSLGANTTTINLVLVQTDGISNPTSVSSLRKVSPSGRGLLASSLNGLSVAGDTSLDGALVVNESGANKDMRVEGDTDTNLLFVDASADYVGVGTNTPAAKLHVSGGIRVTGASDFRGAIVVNEDASASSDVRIEGQTAPNLIFVDASNNYVGLNTNTPASLIDINGAARIGTATVNPTGNSGNVFSVLGGSSTTRLYVTDNAVGVGTTTPSTVGVAAGQTNLAVNGVLNAQKLAVTSGSVTSGLTGIYFGSHVFSGTYNMAAANTAQQDVSVVGASVGDFVLVGPPTPNATGFYTDVVVWASVTAANTVRVAFRNESASTAYTFASTSVLKVLVFSAQALP